MSDDAFRIIITIAVALACIAFLVQAGLVFAMYRVTKKMQQKVTPLVEKAEPVLVKLGPVSDKVGPTIDTTKEILAKTNQILDEVRPRIAEISTEAVAMAKTGRQQVERIGELIQDAGNVARTRLHQIDASVESTVDQVERAGESVKRAVSRPVREVNGVAAGISAAVSTLVKGRRSSVESATQDEEMFI